MNTEIMIFIAQYLPSTMSHTSEKNLHFSTTFIKTQKPKKMKILTLIIKQKWFDEIMSGKKKTEYRELTPQNMRRLVEFDSEGFMVEDPENNRPNVPKKYDAIRFYVGYAKDRDTALVEVTGVDCDFIRTEEGEPIYSGDPQGEDFWAYVMLEYHLGRIIEKQHTHGH